jgi:hypothetical protein
MRRKSTGPKVAASGYDVTTDIRPEKLQAFAAIMLTWNYIETYLDATLGLALQLRVDLFPHVTSRINGIDGKVAILKECAKTRLASEEVRLSFSKTLNSIEQYKKLRDGVAHVRIADPKADIADTIQKRGVSDEVLISQAALDALYEHIVFIGGEISLMFRIFYYCAVADEKSNPEDERREAAQLAEQHLAQLRETQKSRERLQPLPKFPDEHP